MKSKTTNTTLEYSAFPVSPANITTPIASLTGVMTIDKNHTLAEHFSPMFVVKVLKGATAVRAVKEHRFAERFWSPSYYVGTAGTVTEQTIQKYIQEQEKPR